MANNDVLATNKLSNPKKLHNPAVFLASPPCSGLLLSEQVFDHMERMRELKAGHDV
jgi:hypothetical protein